MGTTSSSSSSAGPEQRLLKRVWCCCSGAGAAAQGTNGLTPRALAATKGQTFCCSWRRARRALALAATVLAAAVPSAAAQATVTSTVVSSGLGATFLNACTGELIEMSGTVQTRFHATFDPPGWNAHRHDDHRFRCQVGVGLETGTKVRRHRGFLSQTNIHQGGWRPPCAGMRGGHPLPGGAGV